MVLGDFVIHLSYPLAFLAGLVSFLSPCVFPLVPAYAAFLGGQATDKRQGSLLTNGLSFVLGFSAVFVVLFYVFSALNITPLFAQHRPQVNIVAGIIVIALALFMVGIVRWPSLQRERRFHFLPKNATVFSAFLLGVTFAAGWTPCIGPQLTAILAVASQGNFDGLPVMIVYCLGLAVPFLCVALLTDRLRPLLIRFNRHLGLVNIAASVILLVFGIALLTNHVTIFNNWGPQTPFDL